MTLSLTQFQCEVLLLSQSHACLSLEDFRGWLFLHPATRLVDSDFYLPHGQGIQISELL